MVATVTLQTSSSLLELRCWTLLQLGELAVAVRHDVLLEFGHGLAAEVGAIHQEQHAPGAGMLDQAVGEGTGGVRSCQRRWPSGSGRGVCPVASDCSSLVNGFDLASHAMPAVSRCGTRRRRVRKVIGLLGPFRQSFGLVESENRAERGSGFGAVPKKSLGAGGFVKEAQLALACRKGGRLPP